MKFFYALLLVVLIALVGYASYTYGVYQSHQQALESCDELTSTTRQIPPPSVICRYQHSATYWELFFHYRSEQVPI